MVNDLDWEYRESLTDSSKVIISQQKIQNKKLEEAQSNYEIGLVLHDSGKYLQAETAFLKTINLAENADESELLAYSFHYLGRIESWKSNFIKSIDYHKKALNIFSGQKISEYVPISNNHIASGFEVLGEHDSSLVYYRKNIENRKIIDSKINVINSYQSLARLYAKLYNYKLAYSYLQEGIEYAEETGEKYLLAEVYFTAGKLFLNNSINKDIALEYLQEAKKLFTELNNWEYINWINLCIGEVYYKTGNDSLAMQYFRSLTVRTDKPNYLLLSQSNHMIGMVYKRNSQYDSSLVYLKESIDFMCKECPEIGIHKTLVEAARIYLIKNNFQQAFLYLNRARNIANASKSGMEMIISYEELAYYYKATHQADSTIHYLTLANNLAKEFGLLERIKETAESLGEMYYLRKEFQTSSNYLRLSNQMTDSLASIEKYKEIGKLEMRFEIEKKEEERNLEARILQSEIAKQKLIRNSFIAGAFLFIIIGILLLKAYRSKKKDNQLLIKQKNEIQEISKQLQNTGKRKLEFFTNISHEIRTPLTLIKAPLEKIIKSDHCDKTIISQVQLALNNTNKLKTMVNQILDLQKLDEHQLNLDLSEFDIVAFCREIVSSFEGYCYQSNCKLGFESNIGKALINFDQGRLQSIINNLLSNAFKFNREDGFVHFNLTVKANQLMLKISDTGKGIAAGHLKKLGERYYQVEKSDFSVEGTGIGLAYVKELVELMNGTIEISSTVNEGTTVVILLPCDKIKIHIDTPVTLNIKAGQLLFDQWEEQLSDNVNGLPCVLIIEDNFELLMFLRDLFTASYYVICAKDGQQGKEMALKYIPDLILSDIMMPGIKGNELCKTLKNDINTSHITIILFTAKGAPESIIDGYDCGADDYIIKPFDSELLVKKVKNIISTGENARKQFSFTDIERNNTIHSEFDKKFLKDSVSIIKENIGNSRFTVEFLAESMNLHRRTLLRKFNALTGKSPIDLIRHIRMSKAAELIKDKKYRVNEVAYRVGYEDTNRFSQAFKQFHGVSPSAFYS